MKTARIAQVVESVNARDILKSSARACESADPPEEALASVGWDLRKGRSPCGVGIFQPTRVQRPGKAAPPDLDSST